MVTRKRWRIRINRAEGTDDHIKTGIHFTMPDRGRLLVSARFKDIEYWYCKINLKFLVLSN